MNRKEEIYKKALDLFLEKGYDRTPLSLIAEEMGISKAALYHYFPTKDNLLFSIIEYLIEGEFVPVLEKARKISDPQLRLTYFVRAYVEILAKNPSPRIVIHEARRLEDEEYKKIRKYWMDVYELVRQAISEMQASGKAKHLNTSFSAFALIGMCSWMFYWFDYSREESVREVFQTFDEIFMKGLLSEK